MTMTMTRGQEGGGVRMLSRVAGLVPGWAEVHMQCDAVSTYRPNGNFPSLILSFVGVISVLQIFILPVPSDAKASLMKTYSETISLQNCTISGLIP